MRLLTDAILTRLGSGGRTIGDAKAPTDTTRPYATLWPVGAVDFDGDLRIPDRTGFYHHQVTCVGDTREQAQGLMDELYILARFDYVVAGYQLGPVSRDDILPMERDDAVQPPVWYSSFMFKMFVAPA